MKVTKFCLCFWQLQGLLFIADTKYGEGFLTIFLLIFNTYLYLIQMIFFFFTKHLIFVVEYERYRQKRCQKKNFQILC